MFLLKDDQTDQNDNNTQADDPRIAVVKTGHISEVHPIPPGDQRQREEDRGENGQKLHIAVLSRVDLRLIRFLHLLRIFQQMSGAAHQPVRPVCQRAEILQLLFGIVYNILYNLQDLLFLQ